MPLTITLSDEMAPALGGTVAERQQSARDAMALDLYGEEKITLHRLRQTSICLTDDTYAATLDRHPI